MWHSQYVASHSVTSSLLKHQQSMTTSTVKQAVTLQHMVVQLVCITVTVCCQNCCLSRSVSYIGYAVPRTGEKALTVFLIFSVYWKLGDRMTASDVPNIGGLLFIWVTVPAYSAAAYTPVSFTTCFFYCTHYHEPSVFSSICVIFLKIKTMCCSSQHCSTLVVNMIAASWYMLCTLC